MLSVGDQAHRRPRRFLPVRAHMLRHACGYALAKAGHDTRRVQA
jgi:site-specific recombinase XerD